MINPEHLREKIIRPVLRYLNDYIPYSLAAENLLMGTCAVESNLGEYLVQLNGAPAVGIYQMEPDTLDDIWDNYIDYREELSDLITGLDTRSGFSLSDELTFNLFYATALARVHYYRVAHPLPNENDIPGMAAYWKKHYNTHLGSGTEEKFIQAYERYVL